MNIADDEMQNDLDVEFCQILYMIKPYINKINDHYRLEKYRVWLEKLSSASTSEKLERNKYLIELANQIHDDVLNPPFTFNPPRGHLPPLGKITEATISKPPKRYKEEDLEVTWPYFTTGKSPRLEQPCQNLLTRGYGKGNRSPSVKKFVKLRTVARPFQTLGKSKDEMSPRNSETSSWCDMSGSGTSVALGFDDIEEDEEKKEPDEEIQRPFSPPGTIEEKNVHRARARKELDALKMRVEDLIEVKNALKETNLLSEDRKKTIDNLQERVTILEKENAELKSLLDSQQKKYAELDKAKIKDFNEFKQKLSTSRQNEIEKMKQQHLEDIRNMEKSQSSRMSLFENEYRSKIEEIRNEYQEQIKQLKEANAELLNEKEMEICRLRSELKNRGDSALNDQNNEQVHMLKKCLSKLDRALQKSEKEYVTQIEKLRQELQMRDMTAKMQLQTQRADLIMKGKVANQEEIKQAIESLEQKYKEIMETIQNQAREAKKHDEKQINELRSLLEKHNIAC